MGVKAFFSTVFGLDGRATSAARPMHDRDQHELDARGQGRVAGTENDVIQGADSNATGRNVQEASASPSWAAVVRGAPANPSDAASLAPTTPTGCTWNPRSDRAPADAETIDRALSTASNALKSFIVQVLEDEWNHDARKSLAHRTKKLIRADLETVLGSNRDGEHAPNLHLVLTAWRMKHARAVIGSTVLRSACSALPKHWDRQQSALSGGRRGSSAESDATLAYWLDLAIHALRDVAKQYDHDPAMQQHAAKSKDPIRVFFSWLAQDGKPNSGVEVLVSVVDDALMAILAELRKTFKLTLMRHDLPGLIRCVVLPLVECFLLTKTLDPTWEFQFVPLGKPFSSWSMIDPPLEVEWHVGERSAHARGLGLVETKVVLLTTFPSIPFRFGVAETVLHRAEVLVVPVYVPAPAPTPPPSAAVPAPADPVLKEELRAAPMDPGLEPFAPVCARARTSTSPAVPTLAPAMEPAIDAGQSTTNPALAPVSPVVPGSLARLASAALALAGPLQHAVPHGVSMGLLHEPLVSVSADARIPTPPAAPVLSPAVEPTIEADQPTTSPPVPLVAPVSTPRLASVSVPAAMTPSVQTDAADVFIGTGTELLAGELAALSANLNEIIRVPALYNRPPGLLVTNSHWPRVRATASIITRFLDAFHRIASDPHTDLHHKLDTVDDRLALLRAAMPHATYEDRVSDRLRQFIADHDNDLSNFLGPLHRVWRRPHWVVPFLHNLYQWFRIVLTARLAGYELVMPCAGEPHIGQIACLAHEHIRDCGYKVGVALGPNLVCITDGQPRMKRGVPALGNAGNAIAHRHHYFDAP
ncbi:hypothetical protein GGF32_007670 [Allomyces javanicus]|nr:hypothetical protein GGF32_007670 [Allomyces javanicus]